MPHNQHPGYRPMLRTKHHHHHGHRPKAWVGMGWFHGQALGFPRQHTHRDPFQSTQSLRQEMRALEAVVLRMSRRLKSLAHQLPVGNRS